MKSFVRHEESHMSSNGRAGANDSCRGARTQRTRKVCRSQCMGFSTSLLSQTRTRTKFIGPEAHFHAESIGASPVVIARKTAKLFRFFHLQTQRDPTIVLPKNVLTNFLNDMNFALVT